MKLEDFHIGQIFSMCTGQVWRCTDIGSRTITAIEIIPGMDESWFAGPPYAVPEVVFDEIAMRRAYRTVEEAVAESLEEADEGLHPGYPQAVMQRLMDSRVMGETRSYPRKELLRIDRVDATGEILHPYGAEPAGDSEWQVLLYQPYTEQFTAMPESEFVRLRPAMKDDLRKRSGQPVISKSEFEAANRRGEALRAANPVAAAVCFDAPSGRIVISLSSGVEIRFAPQSVRELDGASPDDFDGGAISPSGLGVHFPKLDVDLYIPTLLVSLGIIKK